MSVKKFFDWLPEARRCESPNQEPRPDGESVSLLVIHSISLPPGQFGTGCIDKLFANTLDCSQHPYFARLRDMHVSSHLLIERTGALVQFVPLDRMAWHAGKSCFGGREACNRFSIGIELEGTDELPYTEAQYEVLIAVTFSIMKAYPEITADRIVGHCDIAPGRKTDPGPCFDWSRYKVGLQPA